MVAFTDAEAAAAWAEIRHPAAPQIAAASGAPSSAATAPPGASAWLRWFDELGAELGRGQPGRTARHGRARGRGPDDAPLAAAPPGSERAGAPVARRRVPAPPSAPGSANALAVFETAVAAGDQPTISRLRPRALRAQPDRRAAPGRRACSSSAAASGSPDGSAEEGLYQMIYGSFGWARFGDPYRATDGLIEAAGRAVAVGRESAGRPRTGPSCARCSSGSGPATAARCCAGCSPPSGVGGERAPRAVDARQPGARPAPCSSERPRARSRPPSTAARCWSPRSPRSRGRPLIQTRIGGRRAPRSCARSPTSRRCSAWDRHPAGEAVGRSRRRRSGELAPGTALVAQPRRAGRPSARAASRCDGERADRGARRPGPARRSGATALVAQAGQPCPRLAPGAPPRADGCRRRATSFAWRSARATSWATASTARAAELELAGWLARLGLDRRRARRAGAGRPRRWPCSARPTSRSTALLDAAEAAAAAGLAATRPRRSASRRSTSSPAPTSATGCSSVWRTLDGRGEPRGAFHRPPRSFPPAVPQEKIVIARPPALSRRGPWGPSCR